MGYPFPRRYVIKPVFGVWGWPHCLVTHCAWAGVGWREEEPRAVLGPVCLCGRGPSSQTKRKCQVCQRMKKVGKAVRDTDLQGNLPAAWGVDGQVVV